MKNTGSLSGMFFLSALAAAMWVGAFCQQLLGEDSIADDFPQVTLQDQDGKQFYFYEDLLRGKIVLINLMDTRCGTRCDQGTQNLVQLQKYLGDRLGREIFIYSITLDPEHDTPAVLKAYAERYGARWSFLTGKIDDIKAVRFSVGLFDPDPKVDEDRTKHFGKLKIGNLPLKSWSVPSVSAPPERILEMIQRTKLPAELAPQRAAQKFTATKAPLKGSAAVTVTIKGISTPNRRFWEPSSPTVKVGDVVEWHAAEGRHGVIFKDFNLAKVVLEFDTEASLPIGPQPGFPAPAQGTIAKTAPPDTLLVRATVKAIPEGVTELPFVCTQHGDDMPGSLLLQAPPKKTFAKKSSVTVTVNGRSTPNLRWDPSSPTVKVGDVVEWHAAEGRHGVIFRDFDVAQLVLEIDVAASLPIGPQPGFPAPAQGTVAKTAPPDTLLVRATVKAIPAGVTEVPFLCTQHGNDMPGSLVLQAPPKKVLGVKKAAPTVTINGIRTPTTLLWEPNRPTVKVGDVVEWHAAEGRHGVIFNDFEVAQLVLEIDTAASLPIGPQDGFPAPAQGTVAKTAPPDTLLVRATVKAIPAGVTEVPFLCTQHGNDMPGSLVLQAPPKKVLGVKKAAPTVTINGLVRPLRWDPNRPTVKVGDVVEWHAAEGRHGVIFNDFEVAQLVLEIDTAASLPIGPQDGFPAPAQGTVAKTAPPDTLLVRATVKAIPAGVTEVPFLCTQHGNDMPGSLVLQAPPKKVLGVKKAAPTVTINGLVRPLRWDPNTPTVKVGDVVEWHAAAGTHGVIFKDFDVAQLVLEIDTAASLPIGPQDGFPAPAQGTVAKTAPPDTLLVRATVKAIPAGVTEVPFLCTRHKTDMEGSLVLQAGPANKKVGVKAPVGELKQVDSNSMDWRKATEVQLVDDQGKPRTLHEFAGQPHIVVLIKGAFCKGCMAQLAEFQQELGSSKIPIVVVTPDDDLEDLTDVPFFVFSDPEAKLFKSLQAFRNEPLHGTFVIDLDGEVLLEDVGSEPYADFTAIKEVLKDSSAR